MRMTPLALLAVALGLSVDGIAHAQVRRCVSPDGTAAYTDRRCEDIGGVERAAAPAQGGALLRRTACARTLQDLVFEVTTAITSNDPNRLAGVYHWTGMSTAQAYGVLPRLISVAGRPLVDITPVMPGGSDADYYPQTTVRQTPVALRIDQTLANGATPVRAVFGLQRHLDCWWLRG